MGDEEIPEQVAFSSEIGCRDGQAYIDISTMSYSTGESDGYFFPLEPSECFSMAGSLVRSGLRAALCAVEDRIRRK